MSKSAVRNTLIGLEGLVVVMALYGGISMLVDAAGFGLKEEWLRGSPFSNYQIPALALLILVGGSSFLAGVSLLRAQLLLGAALSVATGATLMLFEVVETYSFGLRNFQQPMMFMIGLIIAGLGTMLWNAARTRSPRFTQPVHAR